LSSEVKGMSFSPFPEGNLSAESPEARIVSVRAIAREKIYNLPNLLTLVRMLMVPLLVVLILLIEEKAGTTLDRLLSFMAGVVVVAASITDILDGYLARKGNKITTVGKFFDPLADKLLIGSALIMMIPLGRVPAWMALVIVGRELAVTTLRSMAAMEGVVISSSVWGKLKLVSLEGD